MGSSNSYLKLKIIGPVAVIIYPLDNNFKSYCRLTLSFHPERTYKKKSIMNYNEFYKYDAQYHWFDGKYAKLNNIMTDFEPKRTDDVTYLLSELKHKCHMEQYKAIWTKLYDWGQWLIVDVAKPTITIGFWGYKLLTWSGDVTPTNVS